MSSQQKLEVVRSLARAGATITELNTVRKSLSAVKGGKLARIIAPAKTVSFILSDIIGDPLDFIASGPTVLQKEDWTSQIDESKVFFCHLTHSSLSP